jgi:pimeloyl-ACP methyl ester carboxylesterase
MGDTMTLARTARGLHYGRIGQGSPVVLLHGWCLNRRLWMYQEEALSSHATVYSPDLPGFGESAHLDGPYDIDRYATELRLFLDELELTDALVVGFAFGAAVAMALAARDDARIGQLVLIGPPSGATAPYDRMSRAMRRDWPEFARRSALAICKQPHSEATLSWLAGLFEATSLPVALATVELLRTFEPLPLASAVRVPTLVVHGALDDVVPVRVSQTCVERMPCARIEVVPDSGHLVVLDQKERLTRILLECLERNHP